LGAQTRVLRAAETFIVAFFKVSYRVKSTSGFRFEHICFRPFRSAVPYWFDHVPVFPCVRAAASTPVQQLGVIFAHSPSRISLPRYGSRVGLHIDFFEACSAFTRVAACTLALSPIRDTLIEGFSHFVTSMTAPIASGWSDCRVGLAPTGKRRLCTAHAKSGRSRCSFE
jgi:hypothetical protein